jgi:hypothetical protein
MIQFIKLKGSLDFIIFHLDTIKHFYPRYRNGELLMSDTDTIKYKTDLYLSNIYICISYNPCLLKKINTIPPPQ